MIRAVEDARPKAGSDDVTQAGRQPLGGADARRVTAAGLADLAARQAEAIAALDRAVETRLGELDRAFSVRRSNLDALLDASEAGVAALVDDAVMDLRRSAAGERRAFKEAVAAELAAVEEVVAGYREQLSHQAQAQAAELQALNRRVADLELAVDAAAAGAHEPGERLGLAEADPPIDGLRGPV
jgi:hypothetical protein